MINFLKKIYLNKKIKNHLKSVMENCNTGVFFCNSKLYENTKAQILNVKINNQTKNPNNIIFGDYCNVSCNITLNYKGSIKIGDYVFMNYVKMRIDHNLQIGSHCMFGPGVTLWDTDNHPLSVSKRHIQCEEISNNFPLSKSYEANGDSIIIENNVWIGMEALILGGVKIGEGSIVSARSVVTKNVEPYTVVGGVPAKKIGTVPK
jgi:acetyltransferase-like isoleucine patch superfamily enzyme